MPADDVRPWFDKHGRVAILTRSVNFDRKTLSEHDATFGEVWQVLVGNPPARFKFNRGYIEGEREAPVLMLGYTETRRFLVVAIVPSGTTGQWRAITGYEPDSDFYENWYWDMA